MGSLLVMQAPKLRADFNSSLLLLTKVPKNLNEYFIHELFANQARSLQYKLKTCFKGSRQNKVFKDKSARADAPREGLLAEKKDI